MISHAAATTALAARELADEDEDAITPRMTPLRETNGDIVVRLVTRNLEAAREYKQFRGVEAKARACARGRELPPPRARWIPYRRRANVARRRLLTRVRANFAGRPHGGHHVGSERP
jgi:hypothetical protein